MDTINERISKIVNESQSSKTAFAKRTNVSQQYISKVVKTGNPSDLFISTLCKEFNVNEEWLKNGQGEPYINILPEDELAGYISEVIEDPNTPMSRLIIAILKTYSELSEKSKEVFDQIVEDVMENYNKKEG